jgi:DNA polymerase elongation subunit (family B)
MEKTTMFPYSWHMDEDEEDVTAIRIYGINSKNENVCVRIDNFTPFVYLELPENVPWTSSQAQQVGNKLDVLLGDRKPLVKRLMYKNRLYYAHLDKKGRRKKFPYLFLSFSHQSDIRNMSYKIRRPLNIIGIGNIKVKMHEQDASPILQFTSYRNISTAGWVDFVGKKIGKDDKITRCDNEFKVRWKNVTPNKTPTVATPLIMGFDIEVNSTNPSAMPNAEKPGDKVFQISCVLFRHGDEEKNIQKFLLTLGEPDPKTVGEDTEIYMYETEHDLLIGYTEFIQEQNPNIIVGYNILNFDIPYMIERAKLNYCIFDFDQQGFNKYGHAKEKTIKWSSSAYGNQTFQFLDAEGRLYVDLLPLVKRDYKMDNYKLKTISTFFLGCVDPNTTILMWGGSKKLAKDIHIGDELIGDDGTKRTVQDICEGVDDMYEIHQHKFDNYIVNSQHILTFKISGHCSIYWLDKKKMWTIGWLDMNKRKFNFKSMCTTITTKTKEEVYEDMVKYRNTLDTNDILEIKVKDYLTLPDSVKNKLKGYKTTGVQWKHRDVPIDPYIFGMWLGNGDNDGLGFTSQDNELIEKWESWCSDNNAKVEHISGKRWRTSLKEILKKYKLFNNKHIPSIYIQNDRKTRLSLLAGIIDTDGHVGSNGRFIIITQVRKELSEQIMYLTRSLGMSAFCKESHTKWTWNNETKYDYAYEVSISGEGLEDIPTILGYKKCLKRQQQKNALVSGIKITHIGKGPFNGWQIDGNERFLLGDFTVTHNSTKDPLSVKGIFKCYRIGINNKDGVYSRQARKAMGIVGKYCVQDSALVIRLFNKLQTWIGLCEMANTCNVPIFYLYTQGQQIKVYSQLYKYCMYKNFVVEKDGYVPKDNEHYVGATIFTPIAGVYDRVLPFDFASLYPTTIIAYNIDYSTLVIDPNVPDSDCHVMEWEDHCGCVHDKSVRKTKPKHVMCEKRYFRFLKEPRGVMPTVLQNLLNARAHTREQIKVIKKILGGNDIDEKEGELVRDLIVDVLDMLKKGVDIPAKRCTDLNTLTEVLDKRQLAYKVSANSMYGAMGVTRGYLPFPPGAMCTTAMGRQNINIVAKVIPEKFGGELIYGDTDTILPDTPVLIKIDGKIEYRTMEELSNGDWKCTVTGKEISSPEDGLLVWSDIGFTPIKYVIRHSITKPLIRVTTHVGSVDCTLDHSLLWENGDAAKASDVTIGSKLCISELPLPEDTPEEPLYPNKLTNQKIEEYEIPDIHIYNDRFTAELAFVWGMFYADGSCGTYKRTTGGTVSTWAINNQDNKLLQRCADILNIHNIHGIKFRILDTMKSSGVNKLSPLGKNNKDVLIPFVEEYRKLFYDCRKSKRVPSVIFNYPLEFRQAFFMGYYAGDGSKKDPSISCSNKGAIGSAGLFYLMRSIGYQVSINVRKDKPTIYKLTGSTPKMKFRYPPNVVKKIDPTNIYNSMEPLIKTNYVPKPEYIYDIETENHHFAAGVGQLVVHNSNYIVFPKLKTAEENWDHAEHVAAEVTKLFPSPIKLEFEAEIYWRFFILTKKRYMYKKCLRDGVVDKNIGKKGVLLARRDNSMFIRNAYETLVMMVFNKATKKEIILYVLDIIDKLCSHFYSYKDFVVTKSIGSHGGGQVVPFINEKGKKKGKMGDYTVPLLSTDEKERNRQFKLKNCLNEKDYYIHCLPAVVQLAERMRQRGQRVDTGTRLEYVISSQGGHKAKQYVKVEDAIYFGQHSSVLKLDYMYYLKLMGNPFDAILNILFDKEDSSTYKFQKNFVLNQYKYRLRVRTSVLNELIELFHPKITFDK